MPTIHDDIEPWLAASVHDQLSAEERTQLQEHLANCETCRALHAEELATHNMIATAFDEIKPDLAFEQRVLSDFRRKVSSRIPMVPSLAHLFRPRARRIIGTAAALIVLTLSGVWLTTSPTLESEELAVQAVAPSGTLEGLRDKLGFAEYKNSRDGGQISEQPSRRFDHSPRVMEQNAAPTSERVVVDDSYLPSGQIATDEPVTTSNSGGNATSPSAKTAAAPPPAPVQMARDFRAEKKPSTSGSEARPGPAPDQPTEQAAPAPDLNRKLVRNAQVELEVLKFEEAVQKITASATEMRGYVATSSSSKQANGKLRGVVVVKVLPETLDAFLSTLRTLGELKNQTLGTEDVTKQYFDTDSRLKNARIMEQRLLEILKTSTNKVADLLEVEKELGRVRASIEEMQGALKYMDSQVAFATVTITLTEKDMDVPAAFLLKRRAQLALFSNDVEKTFAEAKAIVDGAKAQISSSTLDRDGAGEATARLVLLIVPEEADALIERIKGMGRVQNYNEQTERVAQGGSGMAEGAKVERDKVELSITISRNEQEPALQTTTLSILTSGVSEKVARLKENAVKSGAEIRSSTFNQNPDGQEYANVSLRVPMKNYAALLQSFNQLGKVKDVSVQRQDRRGTVNEETAPADINIQVYSQPSIVSDESGLFPTIRRTLMQGVAALMWSLRMIGVAVAFFAPWVLALAAIIWVTKRISRARKARRESKD